MARDNLGLFSPADIRLIRQQAAAGTLSTREWAAVRGCGVETIRRIARRETYGQVPDEIGAAQPAHAGGTPAHSSTSDAPEPSQEELAASLARLSAAAQAMPPQRAEVNELLDDLAAGRKP